jgi:DNA invertase Pin-like site-specific DNA recombinase
MQYVFIYKKNENIIFCVYIKLIIFKMSKRTYEEFSNDVKMVDIMTDFTDPFIGIDDIKDEVITTEEFMDDEPEPEPEQKKQKTEKTYEIEYIKEHKDKEYLIKWVGYKHESWISEDNFIDKEELNNYLMYDKLQKDKTIQRRAYIYLRTSKRNDQKEVSLYDQEDACKKFAKQYNITIIGVYRDNGISAKNMDNQYALNFITDKIQKGEIIIVFDVSRFSRSMEQGLNRLTLLRNKGAFVHSYNDNVTWNDKATSRATFRQLLSVSQLHSDTVSEKVKSAITFKKNRGDYIGRAPYGKKIEYVNNIRTLVDNIEEQNVIKIINEHANNLLINIVTDNIDNMDLSSSKKTKQNFTQKDYQTIANKINETHKKKNNKLFSWYIIKKILS